MTIWTTSRMTDQETGAPRTTRGGRALGFAAVVALAAVVGACGGSGDDDSTPVLSAAGDRGMQISQANGCAGCHGLSGQGGVGPGWQGLAGSDVELADGSTIVADDEYLVRAIKEPSADLLAGYSVQMPKNNLDDDEVADVIAYIKDLSQLADGTSSADAEVIGD